MSMSGGAAGGLLGGLCCLIFISPKKRVLDNITGWILGTILAAVIAFIVANAVSSQWPEFAKIQMKFNIVAFQEASVRD